MNNPNETTVFQSVDFDLHGLAGIRLLNASPADVLAVTKQLGPIQKPLMRPPDITIRFVERLSASSSMRYLGLDEVAFTDDAMLLLQHNNGNHLRVQIPFEQVGKQCEIVCEKGVPKVPMLIPILNLTVLSKGVVPLHAAAFNYKGTGVLVTGWAKGGKTETLLGFMANGATYVGDEWVYISADGKKMYGIPEPIRIWNSHLVDLPNYRKRISLTGRTRLAMLNLLIRSTEFISRRSSVEPSSESLLERLNRLLKRQHYVHLPPAHLFDSTDFTGVPEKLFYVVSHEANEVKVMSMEAEEVARRMAFSLQYERMQFMSHYLKFRFAFPEARNEFIEHAEETERQMLIKALANKASYAVYHPYPAPIPALFETMAPIVSHRDQSRGKPSSRKRSVAAKEDVQSLVPETRRTEEAPCYP